MKALILRIAKYSGLFALSNLLTSDRLRILGYHGIWFSGEHYGNRLFMGTETFRNRMQWLRDSGYRVLELEDALKRMYTGRLPSQSVVITIDDGWHGTFKHMLGPLKEYGLPATLYVCTAPVDHQYPEFNVALRLMIDRTDLPDITFTKEELGKSRKYPLNGTSNRESTADSLIRIMRPWTNKHKMRFLNLVSDRTNVPIREIIETKQLHFMSYPEIAKAAQDGLDIQLHTHSHLLNLAEPATLIDEIEINRRKLYESINREMHHFCYPGGIYSAQLFPYLEDADIRSATLTESGLNSSQTNKYELKRILDGQYISQIEIEAELSGFIEIVRYAKRRLKKQQH